MKARFIGSDDPAENRVCVAFGETFPLDEWVEVSGLAASKLRGNPMFETKGGAAPNAALDHDGKDGAGGSVAVTSPDEFDAMDDDALRAFITKRDDKAPHHMAGRPRLLALARKE